MAPEKPVPGGIHIRFRHPMGQPIVSMELDGKSPEGFDEEYVYLNSPRKETARLKVWYK